jgi:hypothetical protein
MFRRLQSQGQKLLEYAIIAILVVAVVSIILHILGPLVGKVICYIIC